LSDVHSITSVDQAEPDQFSDVERLDVAGARHGAADAGQDRANGDQDVADVAVTQPACAAKAHRRDDGAADQEDQRVEIEEGADESNPLPFDDTARKAVHLGDRRVERRQDNEHRGDGDRTRDDHRRAVSELPAHQQVDRSLGQRITAQEGSGDVPGTKDRLVPTEDRGVGLGEGADAVGGHTNAPPEQVEAATFGAVA
jgi:hypothetical protein